jgi:hypothetical protein
MKSADGNPMIFLHRLAYALPSHFWGIWLFGLAFVLAVPLWLSKSLKHSGEPGAAAEPVVRGEHPAGLVATCFAAFTAGYIGFMLWAEDFAYKDGHSFTEFSAVGKLRPPAIWPDSGRFWPLGYQEYNVIAKLSPTATAYLLYGAAQLLLGLWLLYLALWRESPTLRLLLFLVLMLAPAFGAVFAELTYADRNVVFAICVLVFAVERYDRRPKKWLLLLAIAASYCGLYFKETSVAFFGGFAAARLSLSVARGGLRSVFRSPLEVGILLACGGFAVELGLTLLPAGTSAYVDELSIGRLAAALRYLKADPLLATFLAAFCLHVIQTLRRGATFEPLWDPLAAGAVLHFAAVSSTGVAETYLVGPAELVAAISLLRLLPRWWNERPRARPILVCVGAVTIAASLAFGTFRLLQRKQVVWQTQRIADFVVSYYRTPAARRTRLYLPAEDGVVMNFVSFLSYRGLAFQRHGELLGVDAIEVAGSAPFEGERCSPSSDFVCRRDVPRPGDLVVRLPEEAWAPTPAARGRDGAELGMRQVQLVPLFQALPAGGLSPLRPLLSLLYRVSPTLTGLFANQPLPNDWLRVSASRVAPLVVAPEKQ